MALKETSFGTIKVQSLKRGIFSSGLTTTISPTWISSVDNFISFPFLISESQLFKKILDLVQNASSRKAPTENFITKFARKYTPVVTIAALALAIIPPLVIIL